MRKRMSVVSLTAALGFAAAIVGLSGCSSAGYYWQGFKGQMQILQAARPIDDWLADAKTPPPLRQRLAAAQQMRRFASQELALPDNASYTRYAQLPRPFAVWNVVAAPPDSLEMHQWCFPITGCIAYRGYFAEADAHAKAYEMHSQGLEVSVYGVPAYSTLGYLNWLGGDPLLSSFIDWQEETLPACCFTSWHTSSSTSKTIPPSTNPLPPRWSAWPRRCGCRRMPALLRSNAGNEPSSGAASGSNSRARPAIACSQFMHKKKRKPLIAKRLQLSKVKSLKNSAALMHNSERSGSPVTSPC